MRIILILAVFLGVVGCRTNDNQSGTKDVESIAGMKAHPRLEGSFLVVCNYHRVTDQPEVRTAQQIRENEVCLEGEGGANSMCSYEGNSASDGVFTIIFENKLYSKNVDGYDSPKIFCRKGLANLYDGDDLYGFNFEKKAFFSSNSIDDNAQVKMDGSHQMIMIYDMDDIYIYDPEVNASSWSSTNSVEDNAKFFSYRVQNRALLIYDGDDYHAYCNGRWNSSNSPNDNDPSIKVKMSGDLLFSGSFSLNTKTCEIQ